MAYVRRRSQRKDTSLTDIPLTPLIDTALTLLIIFMVTSPMLNNVIKVTLPQGSTQEGTESNQELVVYVNQDNDIFFNGKQIIQSELIELLQEALTQAQDRVVFIKADISARYGKIIELVDSIKVIAGVKYVALATQKRI